MTEPVTIEISLAFTRYLYQMVEVKQSLFIALLDHNPEEALYWMYELYYSGFDEEVYDYLLLIYDTVYKKLHPNLQDFITSKYTKWKEQGPTIETNTDIGSIVYTLALRSYCLVDFIRNYLAANVKSTYIDNTTESTQFIVNLKPESIEKYKTFDHSSTIQPCRVLDRVIKYPIYKAYNKLFNTLTHKNFPEAYRTKWLYYASFSPVWYERITNYNGKIDYKNMTVTFDSEDDEEEFRRLWDYEPDETSSRVFTCSVGTGKETMFSLKQFCEKYNYTINSRIIKRNPKLVDT
jgi:hypothetical protein